MILRLSRGLPRGVVRGTHSAPHTQCTTHTVHHTHSASHTQRITHTAHHTMPRSRSASLSASRRVAAHRGVLACRGTVDLPLISVVEFAKSAAASSAWMLTPISRSAT